ncbi:tol-pal system protein YbgF [Methylobacterium radiodurans]|uniref:Cell division coordinator CpoB n=1 Tax=Methylobacterium radiodurans TaxID=2202828 RepID=A0A2U8VWV8_9HYPH|nr:tol-pal system protein YbgF [Methylobacterium radiodurans]AWN38289.1 tol-pal system protein YbgF [Methylobacterium radiodurans]
MLRRLLLSTALVLATALPAASQDASEFVVRLGRLENQSRMMAGQIETLQYENRQLKEQLRKFQEDVEYRLNEKSGAKPSGGTGPVNGTNPGAAKPQKRGDAFDPEQNPGQPGAPRQLGSTAPSAPVAVAPPVTQTPAPVARRLPQGAIDDAEEAEAAAPGYDEPVDLAPPARVGTTGALPARPSASVAATGTGDARSDYETALVNIQARRYEQAEMDLRQFIQSHPRDTNVPAATYWLGESYLQRNRNREAAEQFLKVSTDYARSPQAPEAMLKLGVSLNALGAREQACATLAELERKFPSAGPGVRQGVAREQKRARCTA